MSNCTTCGGFLRDPFDLSTTTSSGCQCNTGGLVTEGAALPTDTCCVTSVNGQVGVVSLTTANVPEAGGYNYYSNSLVAAFIDATTPIVFNTSTGTISHANSGATAGTYGSSTTYPVITVNATGHVTAVSTQSFSAVSIGPDLTAIEALSGTGYLIRTGTNTWALRSISGASGRVVLTYPDGVTGSTVIDLAASGVVAGTYGSSISYPVISVDTYGRVTNASSLVIPTPTLPAHTHTLGELSNVDNAVDTTAAVNDVLYWTGTQWSYKSIAAGTVVYTDTTVTPDSAWTVCTGDGDVDTGLMNQPINLVRRLDDTTLKNVTYVHYAVYIKQDAFIALASLTELGTKKWSIDLNIGTLPLYFRPIHTVSFPATAVLAGSSYWNTGHATRFSSTQLLDSISIVIRPNGTMAMNLAYTTGAVQWAKLGDADYLIVPVSCSFPSKRIVT